MRSAALAACLLVACSQAPTQQGVTLRIAAVGKLEPLATGEQASFSALAQDWVFETLLGITNEGELVPRVAQRFERRPGGSLRVQLREGVRFSDGSKVTDDDLISSMKVGSLAVRREGEWLVLEPGSPEVRVDVQVVRTVLARQGAAGLLGTGPFVVAEQNERRMLLRRLIAAPGKIALIDVKSFDSITDAFSRTMAGEADALPNVPTAMVELFEGVPHLKILRAPGLYAEGVLFNARTMGAELRRALRQDLPQTDAKEVGARDGCAAIPGRASPLAPLPQGPPLRLAALVQDHTGQRLALALRRWLGTRALPLAILDVPRFGAALQSGDFDLVLTHFLVQPRGMSSLFFHTGSPLNYGKYSNPATDTAFDADDWPAAEAALAADPPTVYLCTPERLAIVDSRFKNARLGPYGLFETLPDWEAAP